MPTVTKPGSGRKNGNQPPRPMSLPPLPSNRLPRTDVRIDRNREIRVGVLGVLGLVALVVAVPVLLAVFVGYPLPTSAPSRDWLTTTITASLIIKVLACVVWLVWAHFTICIVAEWRAIRRGRLPGSVPLGGGSQFLARRLVAAALLLAGTATLVPHGGGSSGTSFRAATGTAATAPHAVVAAAPVAGQPQGVAADAPGASAGVQSAKFYVVHPPEGRRYDSLWDIAQRTLGNPLRYKEIFALNKDRLQADGSRLHDANLIRPGWQLMLPADASGPGVQFVALTPPPTAPAVATPAPGPDGSVHVAAGAAATVATGAATPSQGGAVTTSTAAGSTIDATRLALGGGLLLAGLALAVSTRRGPYVAPSGDDTALSAGGDPELAWMLDAELRRLAAARVAQGRPLPQPTIAYVARDRIVLQVAGADTDDPPAPWQRGDDGRSWTLAVEARPAERLDRPAPFPGLVSVGRSHGFELFVDLEQAPGLISVGGDLERAREVVTAIALQAAMSIWSDGVLVHLVGFGDGVALAELAPEFVRSSSRLDDVLATVEADAEQRGNLQRQLGVDGVLTGRLRHRGAAWRPQLVVLSAPPTADEAIRLQALTANGRTAVVALTVGDSHDARWRFAVDAAGQLGLGVLGVTAQAHRLTAESTAELLEVFHAAGARRRRDEAALRELSPANAAHDVGDFPGGDGPTGAPDGAALAVPAAVSVRLLGSVQVEAPGDIDPARRDLATEIVVAAALRPEGLHDAVLRAEIWPRGVPDDVLDATVADVQRWLGTGPDGSARLYRAADGRWRLTTDVRSDWDELRILAAIAGGPSEEATLRRALGLIRGTGFSGPAGRYGWFAFGRTARDARVVATAVARRAAELAARAGRIDDALSALRAGLVLVPTSELLWRELLTLAGRGGPGSGGAVAREMYAALAVHRVRAEPATDALVAQVAPGYDAPRTA